MMKLNDDLIAMGSEVLSKKDRITLFGMLKCEKMSSVYGMLQGNTSMTRKQYDIIQKYILKKNEQENRSSNN